MNFSGFAGNGGIKALFSDAFDAGRFPHAVILQGEQGTGKRSFAKLLAKALVCRDKPNAPCGKCPSCIRAEAGSHPDIRIEQGSGATRSLSVESAKGIIADSYRMPEEAQHSVYLIFIENKISDAVQNKLLKTIEEPPKGAVFIITCKNSEILLPTIRSRAQIFTLNAPDVEQAAQYARENMGLDEKEAGSLARLCGGNIGKMQTELSGGEEKSVHEKAERIAMAVVSSKEQDILAACATKDRNELAQILSRLLLIFRDTLVYRLGGTSSFSAAPKAVEALSSLSVKRLLRLVEIVEESRRKLEQNANMALLVTWFCAAIREAAGK